MLPKVLKNFNLFIDGRGYAGRIEEVTLPKLVHRTEEYRLGGLDTPVQVDMGMEKLECDLTLSEYDAHVIKLFGIEDESLLPTALQGIGLDPAVNALTGFTPRGLIPLTMRGGLSDEVNDRVVPVVIYVEGSMIELDLGQWRAGEKTTLKIRLALRYYRLTVDNENLIEIDVDNRVRQVAGNDQIRPRGLLSGVL
jgi:phage tail tube protein FII